ACESEAIFRTFQRCYVSFQRFARGIPAPGIFVALVAPQALLDVGGREIHWSHDGAGERFGALSRMDCPRAESGVQIVVVDTCHQERSVGSSGKITGALA